ncbi:MAG: phospholipase C, phosphocholine-specific [Actinomycetota bacterium]|nr:phospholipase C, phosphocholine-specific [Actinomycetota bacterium]
MTDGNGLTRRQLLASGAGTGAAALGASSLLETLAQAAKPSHHGLGAIEHIVVFMQENRSFDSYFGTLGGVRGFEDKHARKLSTGHDVFHQPDPLNPNEYELPFHLNSSQTSAQCVADLSHAWDVQHAAWNGGRMDNWLPAHRAADGTTNGPLTMGYYTRADIPFHYALADTFTICDGYHCSVMGPTNPNRLYLWSGTIDPDGKHGGPVIDNSETPPYTWTTYPERLQRAGVSWRIYQEADNYDDNALAWFQRFQQAPKSSPLYANGLTKRGASAFADDVASGHLPQVSWIIAPTAQSEHPTFTPAAGAELTHSYLHALARHPKVWAKTVFLLTWDENDGFFDHVPPPTAPKGTPGEYVGGLPIGLGFRVPMVVISPWSVGGFVCSQTFDHTSVIRLIERRFGVHEPNISRWRRRTCGDLTATLGLGGQPHRFPRLPNPNGSAHRAAHQCTTLPAPTVPRHQKLPKQEAGTRPRRG